MRNPSSDGIRKVAAHRAVRHYARSATCDPETAAIGRRLVGRDRARVDGQRRGRGILDAAAAARVEVVADGGVVEREDALVEDAAVLVVPDDAGVDDKSAVV